MTTLILVYIVSAIFVFYIFIYFTMIEWNSKNVRFFFKCVKIEETIFEKNHLQIQHELRLMLCFKFNMKARKLATSAD